MSATAVRRGLGAGAIAALALTATFLPGSSADEGTSDQPPALTADLDPVQYRTAYENALGQWVKDNADIATSLYAETPDADAMVLVKAGADASSVRQGIDEAVSNLGRPSGSVKLETVPKSRAELLELHAGVDALLSKMNEAGARINGTGPDYRLGKIQIDIDSGQAEAERVLGELVRDVHFVKSPSSDPNLNEGALVVGRYSDTPPYYGGDGIFVQSGVVGSPCTAGFPVKKNGIRYMLSAGHCVDGQNGRIISPAINTNFPDGPFNPNIQMGHSSQSNFTSGLDSTLIAGNFSNRIWIGSRSTSTSWPVVAFSSDGNEMPGRGVCHGGATSGQQCGYVINVSPYTWNYPAGECTAPRNEYLYNMTKAIGNASRVKGGDSGGAVYSVHPAGAQSVRGHGTISGNGCNTDLVYQPIYRTQQVFGTLTVP